MHWQTTRFRIDLSRPRVMGIVNVTPDSFSDAGDTASHAAACARCDELLRDGADMLDIGGESTRPGALPVSVDDELQRVLPVLRHAVTLGVPVSVDTYKPAVMRAALDLGVDIINDIWALRWSGDAGGMSAQQVVAEHPQCGVCLMHMHRDPRSMQVLPMEGDVVAQVCAFLAQQAQALRDRGVAAQRICLDPGIGFGKTVPQNFSLLAHQSALCGLGYPVLAGWSRKSSLVAVTQNSLAAVAGLDVAQRLAPSLAAALLAVQNGAAVVRVHDVRQTVQVLQVLAAVEAVR